MNALALEFILKLSFLGRSTNEFVDQRKVSFGINGDINDSLVRKMPLNVSHLDNDMTTVTIAQIFG